MALTLFVAIAAAGLLATAGCGGNDPEGPQRLTATESRVVAGAQQAVRSYCHEIALYLAGRSERPTSPDAERADAAVDRLLALAREKPDATYQSGSTVRDVIGDTAEDLEGTNCSPQLEERLTEGLDGLPPPSQ